MQRVKAAIAGAITLVTSAGPSVAFDVSSQSAKFAAIEVLTADPSLFERRQGRPVTDEDFKNTSAVGKLGAVTAIVLFKNCTVGVDGRCHLKVLFSLVDPGGVVKGPALLPLWEGTPPAPDTWVRSLGAPSVQFDSTDAPGTYRIEMTVKDEVGGVTQSLSREVDYGR